MSDIKWINPSEVKEQPLHGRGGPAWNYDGPIFRRPDGQYWDPTMKACVDYTLEPPEHFRIHGDPDCEATRTSETASTPFRGVGSSDQSAGDTVRGVRAALNERDQAEAGREQTRFSIFPIPRF